MNMSTITPRNRSIQSNIIRHDKPISTPIPSKISELQGVQGKIANVYNTTKANTLNTISQVGFLQSFLDFSKTPIAGKIFCIIGILLFGLIISAGISGNSTANTIGQNFLSKCVWAWIWILVILIVLNFAFGFLR